MRRALIVLACASIVGSGAARAQTPRAVDAPLRGFTPFEVERIAPLLEVGIVGLVELPAGDQVPAVHLAAYVDAEAEVVRDVLARPAQYPTFMPAVSEVVEHDRHGGVVGFTWRWRTSIFALGGEAMLALFEPPRGQRARGYRVTIERTGGDLGEGREVWRILPSGRRSLVLLSTRMDLRDSNYITRQMASASLTISRSVNLAMGVAMLSRARIESERRAGVTRPPVPEQELHRPPIDLARVDPLLRRGDLLLLDMDGTELRQVSVASRLPHDEARVRSIMLDPVAFSQALIAGSRAVVRERRESGVLFDWALDVPIVGTAGAMELSERADRTIALEAVSGALQGGRWRFVTHRLEPAATAVLGWARFDAGSASFILRAVVDADAGFAPGLSAATEVMMVRALRVRLQLR